MTREQIAEKIFRDYYVSLYPKDKPISEMTSTEQGMYKQTLIITGMVLFQLKALEKPKIDERKLAEIIWDKIQVILDKDTQLTIKGAEEIEEILARGDMDNKLTHAIVQKQEEWLK